jgi:hypothetical protein
MGMLVEPDLDRGVLAAALNREYGLAAGAVRFIPRGGRRPGARRLTDERGRRWFLKLAELQRLPWEAELLAFEPGCDEYCEREVDEVQWQGGRVHLHLGIRLDDPPPR